MSSAASWPNPPDPERRALEQALVAVVCELGLRDTTVEAVCERAGVEPRAYRSHFADVEEGYRRLFELGAREVLMDALVAFAAPASYPDRLRAVAHAMYRFMAVDERRARFLYVEVFSAGEATQLIRDQLMEGMYELIDHGRQELADPDSISRATAEAIGGSILSRIRISLAEDDLESLRIALPQLMYNVVLPYVGDEVARLELEIPPPEHPLASASERREVAR